MNKVIPFTILTAAFALVSGASAPVRPAAVVTMTADMKFVPATVVIHKGQTVAWQNTSPAIHNVVDVPAQSPDPAAMKLPKHATPFDSGLLNYGAAYVHTFTVPGTYRYACTLHIANGMVGKVVVK